TSTEPIHVPSRFTPKGPVAHGDRPLRSCRERSADAERLTPQGHHRHHGLGLDLDLHERPRLRVARATGQTDGLVGPGDRAALARELVALLVRLVAEVIALFDVEQVEGVGPTGALGRFAAALGADTEGLAVPGALTGDAALDAAATDVDLAAHDVAGVDLAALGARAGQLDLRAGRDPRVAVHRGRTHGRVDVGRLADQADRHHGAVGQGADDFAAGQRHEGVGVGRTGGEQAHRDGRGGTRTGRTHDALRVVHCVRPRWGCFAAERD